MIYVRTKRWLKLFCNELLSLPTMDRSGLFVWGIIGGSFIGHTMTDNVELLLIGGLLAAYQAVWFVCWLVWFEYVTL